MIQQPIPIADASRLANLCVTYLRVPSEVLGYPGDTRTLVVTPELTAAEQTTYARLLAIARSTIPAITPAEWQAIEPDIAGLRTYRAIATPTLAQTVLAVKAQSRILRALLRD